MSNLVRLPRWLAVTGISIILLAIAATVTYAAASTSTMVDQSALRSCLAASRANCESAVPGLSRCMESHSVCNEDAQRERVQNFTPLQPPSTSSTSAMTMEEAIARAKLYSPEASASSPTIAKETTLRGLAQMRGTSGSEFGGVNLDRKVWVVTVHAPLATDGRPGHPPVVKVAYTVVFDEGSRAGLELCIGCATLG